MQCGNVANKPCKFGTSHRHINQSQLLYAWGIAPDDNNVYQYMYMGLHWPQTVYQVSILATIKADR